MYSDYKISSIQTTDQSDRIIVTYRISEGEERDVTDKETGLTSKQYQRDKLVESGRMVIHSKAEDLNKEIRKILKEHTKLVSKFSLHPDQEKVDAV